MHQFILPSIMLNYGLLSLMLFFVFVLNNRMREKQDNSLYRLLLSILNSLSVAAVADREPKLFQNSQFKGRRQAAFPAPMLISLLC